MPSFFAQSCAFVPDVYFDISQKKVWVEDENYGVAHFYILGTANYKDSCNQVFFSVEAKDGRVATFLDLTKIDTSQYKVSISLNKDSIECKEIKIKSNPVNIENYIGAYVENRSWNKIKEKNNPFTYYAFFNIDSNSTGVIKAETQVK